MLEMIIRNPKKLKFFLCKCVIVTMIAALGACSSTPPTVERSLSFDTRIYIDDIPLDVVVFETQEEQRLGLMYVEELFEGTGALFVFEKETAVRFWMKNTQLPLDMLFFNRQGKLIYWVSSIQPCITEDCEVVRVGGVKYVVEMKKNSGIPELKKGLVMRIVSEPPN